MIRNFHFGAKSRTRLARQMALMFIPVPSLATAGFLILADRVTGKDLVFLALWLGVFLAIIVHQFKKRLDLVMRVYEVRLYRDSISVVSPVYQGNLEVNLDRDEITGIVEHPGRGIQLLSADPNRKIYLFDDIEDFNQLRSVILEWGSVESRPAGFWHSHGMHAMMLGMIALTTTAMLSTDLRIAIPSSIAVVGILGWAAPKLPLKVGIMAALPAAALVFKIWILVSQA